MWLVPLSYDRILTVAEVYHPSACRSREADPRADECSKISTES
jgi:hypothetical protein